MATGQSDFAQAHASEAGAADAGPAVVGFPGGARIDRSDGGRHRYAWLYDDEDIWGADRIDCAPPVIDGDDWRAPRI